MVNVVIPMSGKGSRFQQAGYKYPKPLIDVFKKPMIQRVVENIPFGDRYIFIVLKEHCEKYCLNYLLPLICQKLNPNTQCEIIEIEEVTQGAACTVLLAEQFINNDEELIIANSDQWIDWDPLVFLFDMHQREADAGIVTFTATEPKWSFAKLDENNKVTQVAEKNPISDCATVGIYYYKFGKIFVDGAKEMISKNIRVNNEFYVCPVFNEIISKNYSVLNYHVETMHGLGTPEDLESFLLKKSTLSEQTP